MGNKTINNVDPQFSFPYDRRLVVDDLTARDALITDEVVYEGIIVYVKDNGLDKAEFYTYINTGTVSLPVLEWVVFGISGGGTDVHNDLSGIQGGISNTEHFHLNQNQYDWVVDSTPFNAPSAGLITNVGPTWNYDNVISQPVILSASIVQNQGTNVRSRILDPLGVPLDLDGGVSDPNGWVDVIGSEVIIYTFSIVIEPNKSIPVNTLSITGDSAQYKLQTEYLDDALIQRTITRTLTYVSKPRDIDEVWFNDVGNNPLPNPAIPSTIPSLGLAIGGGLPQVITESVSKGGIVFDFSNAHAHVVIVISKDIVLTPSEVQVMQHGTVIYQPESTVYPNGDWAFLNPYTGDTSASQGTDFFMLYMIVPLGGVQSFQLNFVSNAVS